MADLNQLIQIAPFPDDVKADLAVKIPNFTDVQKGDLENLSWDLIRESYEDKIAYKTNIAMTEVALGKKKASEVDLGSIRENIFNELSTKLEGIATSEQIHEVREKLQQQAQTPKVN